jgi:hypothetical protein
VCDAQVSDGAALSLSLSLSVPPAVCDAQVSEDAVFYGLLTAAVMMPQ